MVIRGRKNRLRNNGEKKRQREALSVLIFVINERLGEKQCKNKGERPVTANPHH